MPNESKVPPCGCIFIQWPPYGTDKSRCAVHGGPYAEPLPPVAVPPLAPPVADLGRQNWEAFGELMLANAEVRATAPNQAWPVLAEAIHRRALQVRKTKPGSLDDLTYLALGFAGEAGELVNVIKKMYRGDAGEPGELNADLRRQLEDEYADVVVYFHLLECFFENVHGFDTARAVGAVMRKLRAVAKARSEKWGIAT